MIEDIIENGFGKESFETIFEISPIGMGIVKLNGDFLRVNSSLSSILGFSQEELLSLNFKNLSSPEDLVASLNYVQKILDREINHFKMEKRFVHKTGKIVYAMLSVTLIRDKNNKPICFLFQIQDITSKYRELEQTIKTCEEKYSQFIRDLPDAIAVLDYDWRYVLVNDAAVKNMTKVSEEELIGVKLTDIQPGIENTSFYKEYKYVMDTRNPRTIVDQFQFHDGRLGYYEVRILPVLEGIMLIGIDIGERIENQKKLVEVLEMDKLRSEFFANLSHELRTPLNIILSSIQMMDQTINNMSYDKISDLSRYVQISRQNCYRLVRMVSNLIDTTKLDTGFFSLHKINCNIVSIVEEITLSIKDYVKTKNIELIFDTLEEEITTDIDPDIIERVILNLLSNAYKFTKQNGSINVYVFRLDDNVIIEVSDSGIGIPSEKLKTIFERFRQADKSLTRSFEGSGIGLSLSKSLIELHGGSICVESEINKGSKFIIKLPIINEKRDDAASCRTYNDSTVSHVEKINIEFSDIYSVIL